MEWRIRPARREDLPGILEVLRPWNMHHIPSPEMGEIDFSRFFVAERGGRIVGVSGYKMADPQTAKTTLLAVLPPLQRTGLGRELQQRRLEAMSREGAQRVVTNADRVETIVWYKKHFGYREAGRLEKKSSFGDDRVAYWTTLEMDLGEYMAGREDREAAKRRYIERHDPVPLASYEPLVINACITGAVPTKLHTPHVPTSREEIVAEVSRLYEAGVSIVHLHTRDEEERPVLDPGGYEALIREIRSRCPGLICCVSTSGRGGVGIRERAEVLLLEGDARPDMASLILGSVNFLDGVSATSNDEVQYLAQIMKERGIKPEIEIFDSGMFGLLHYMRRHEILEDPLYINIMTGNLNGIRADLEGLAALKRLIPDRALWAVGALGVFEMPMHMMAIAAGAHVRVGLEDSLYYDTQKRRPATNLELVERIKMTAKLLGREIATPAWTRRRLGL